MPDEKGFRTVFLATIFSTPKVISQISIGGVINDYSQVTTIDSSCGKISVVSIGPFKPNDLILIIQMQGAEIDQTDLPSSGSVTNLKNAGFYELAEVSHIAGTTISLKHKLVHTYDPDGKVQVVKIPIYNNAKVTSPLTATTWNGNTGVLALKVNGTLELQADINVNSTGFRGGSLSFGTPDCDEIGYAYPDQSTHAARKGEGVSIANVLTNKGRGANGNGGGGGNEHNGGGGGGSTWLKVGKVEINGVDVQLWLQGGRGERG
ncbi:MAG: hypothetical protein IPJ06_08420 [Saprospiraceae bacterium]|nr:hypothetical protein [Saprospiraceae bacterium]